MGEGIQALLTFLSSVQNSVIPLLHLSGSSGLVMLPLPIPFLGSTTREGSQVNHVPQIFQSWIRQERLIPHHGFEECPGSAAARIQTQERLAW
mmetsp:Transcript_632/g.1238  ORF Transcript_632/g.1238 Transcript_632/m.1238 type:complete len:93 (-) Transcript_632:649-927(-)